MTVRSATLGRCACENLLGCNPVTFGMLGLCPMLAVSTSFTPAISLGLVTTTVLVVSAAAVSMMRTLVPESVRLPFFMLTVSAIVILIGLALARHFPGLSERLGIFLPLVITNCVVLARLESCAYRSEVPLAVTDALSCGLGLTLAIAALAAARSLLALGAIPLDLSLLSGAPAAGLGANPAGLWDLRFFLTPAGGFVCFGMMAAAANAISRRGVRRSEVGTYAPKS